MMVGFGQVFIPGLEEVQNGTQAISFLAQCIDFEHWKSTASFGGNQFGFQAEAENTTEAELRALEELTAQTVREQEGNDEAFILDDVLEMFLEASDQVWRLLKRVAAFFMKIIRWFLQIVKKARKCGPVDLILGIVIMSVLSVFPPGLIIATIINVIVKVAQIVMLVVIVKTVIDLIKALGKNWFEVGRKAAQLIGYIIMLILAYKARKSGNKVSGCTEAQRETCNYRWRRDEMKSKTGSARLCPAGQPPANTCNRFIKNDNLIDPYKVKRKKKNKRKRKKIIIIIIFFFKKKKIDSKGRTNIERMRMGTAPIGPDGRSVNLHHVTQTQDGYIQELTRSNQIYENNEGI